jgi:hypothetical protein
MKVTGFNGSEYNLDLKKYIRNHRGKRSQYHILARGVISELFNGYSILEEVKLPGSRDPAKRSVLYLDFFIPNIKVGVEVHGEQHYKYVPFFHKSKAGFLQAQTRDRIKVEWCELNSIELIVLKYDSTEEYWREQLERRR